MENNIIVLAKKDFFTLSKVNKIQQRDEIKKDYCHTHNIPLIIIPYTDYKIIDCNYILERIRTEQEVLCQ